MMAEPRMDVSTLVGKLLEGQDGDVLRQGARGLAQALMDTEVTALAGAERHERTGHGGKLSPSRGPESWTV